MANSQIQGTSSQPNVQALTRAAYSGFDYATISDDLRTQLQVNFASSYNDFSQASLGLLLLSSSAYATDALSFYVDRRATDNYLVTARTRKSVARLTRQVGYKMGAAVSASLDLQIIIPSLYSFSIPIPAGFQFKGPNGLIYQSSQSLTIATGAPDALLPHTVPCYEGQTISESFISDGTANQVFTLRRVPPNKFVMQGTVTCLVNGTPYTEVDFINFEPPTNQFEVGYNDDPPTIRFGDGVAGIIPPQNQNIQLQYVAGSGAAGRVTSGQITAPVTPLVVNFQTIPLVINNPTGSISGDDAESLEHAKVFAGLVWKTRQVAVTQEDYQSLAGAYADPLFGRVAVAEALSIRSAAQDLDLNNQISIINDEIDAPSPYGGTVIGTIQSTGTPAIVSNPLVTGPVDGVYVSDIKMRLAQITADTVSITGALTGIASQANTSNNNLTTLMGTSATTGLRGIQTALQSVTNNNTAANTDITTASASIVGLPTPANTNYLSAATKTYLTSQLAVANTALTDPTNGISSIVTVGANQLTTPTRTFLTQALSSISNALNDTVNGINAITAATASALALSDNSAISALLADALSKLGTISSSASTAGGIVTAQMNNVSTIQASMTTIGTSVSTPGSLVLSVLSPTTPGPVGFNTDIVNQIGDTSSLPPAFLVVTQEDPLGVIGVPGATSTFSFPIQNKGLTILSDIETIQAAIVDQYEVVSTATADIFNHVDSILASDCQSNLVTVPILSTDSSGFYAPPSNGLIVSLENYLNARKEVTQTVQVVSGGDSLIYAVVDIRVGYIPGFAANVIASAVGQAVDSVLKGRSFGEALYDNDLYEAIDQINGIKFTNIIIYGYLSSIAEAQSVSAILAATPLGQIPQFFPNTVLTNLSDPSGNLIVDGGHIVTKGVVNIMVPELVTS